METVTTYTPPDILSEIDDDMTHQTMLSNLPADIDKTDGGFAHDFTRPAAVEKAEMMLTLNEALQLIFPEWAYGSWLDKHAASAGLTRREATYAEAELTVTGTEGTLIPQGFIFTTVETDTSASVQFEATEPVLLSSESTTVHVRCTEAGIVGDVPEHSIVLMASTLQGIRTVTNEKPATGGSDEESDAELYARIADRDRNADVSYVGNDADYKRWALEVDGVGSASVVPEWQGAGTGTVKIIIMGADGSPAQPSLIKQVEDHIMSPDDRSARLAPVGAILTVVTAEAVDVNIAATVTLDEGAILDTVIAAFKANMAIYFEEAMAEGSIVYTRVGSTLSETQGVFDYTGLTVNGGTANIPISVSDYPKLGTVTIQEGE